jgi:hypothetical protein
VPRSIRLAGFLIVTGWLLCPPVSNAADDTWRIGVSTTYESGDYGTGSRTSLLSTPLTIRRLFADGNFTVTIPYLYLQSSGSVTLVNGIPIQISNTKTNRRQQNLPPARSTTQGLGDITLQGRYYLMDEQGLLPTISLTGKLKTPTANPDDGLGTGEFDENVGIGLMKKLTDQLLGFVDVGYTFIGKQPGLNLLNQWSYDVGLGYNVTKQLMLSAYYEEYYKLVATQVNPRDVLFSMTYKATSALRLTASATAGLSNGAPQYGLTGGVSVQF